MANQERQKKYRLGSLFSGCGGFDLGFKNAGFELVWANDINPDACSTFRENVGDIIEGSIHDIDINELGAIDVLTAGFPCQPFSNAGSRKGINDDRGTLVEETYRFIEHFNPKVVVYENVRGFLSIKGKNGKLIDEISKHLEDAYGYKTTYRLLNFSHFGVPQRRLRVVMLAVKEGVDVDLLYPEIDPFKDISIKTTLSNIRANWVNQKEIMKLNPQALHYGSMIPEGGSWKSLDYDVLPDRWKKIRDNMVKYHYPNFFKRYGRNDVMGTITAAFKPENAAVWHPTKDRIYTVREIATFQTFPKDFKFFGRNIKSKYQQIGNAVPPLFMEKLASRISMFLDGNHDGLSRVYPDSNEFNVNKPLTTQLDKVKELLEEETVSMKNIA